MKKGVSLLAVLLLMMLLVTPGYAQVKAGSVNITPTIGMYKFEGNEDLKSTISLGLRAGYNFSRYIGVEAYAHYVPTAIMWSNNTESDIKFVGYGLEGVFNILPDSALVPFVALGVGGAHYSNAFEMTTEDRRDKFTASYGGGLKYFLSENFALRADVRHIIPFDSVHNNLLATVGLTIAFGGAKKAEPAPEPPPPPAPVAPVVLDSDKDGVPDNADKCPGTPAGVAVDQDGCPLDSDKDGVPDYRDKCPGTPAGVKVDNDGCPPPVVQEVKPKAAAKPAILEKGKATLNVQFDHDKATIKKGFFNDIDELADVLKQNPDLNIEIDGHTDSTGAAAYNKKLSQARAEAVVKYLVHKHGIDTARRTARGFGEDNPIASNKTAKGRAQNRRVEAVAEFVVKK